MMRAKLMAERQPGSGFQLHIGSLRISGRGGTEPVAGVVTAWNEREITDVPVHRDENRDWPRDH
jgi:hypothetical protein